MGDEQTNALGFIVDRLNDQPFQMNLTMVAFDEKSPFELLEVVNEVMAHLSDQHKIDLRDETPDATAQRMLEFLRVLNYKMHPNIEPQQAKGALLHGDPQLIYPILSWMLQKLPDLKKRAYLARFLVNVEVPEHMFSDEEVIEVYQNYKDLQEEFKEMHKTSEKYKSQLISPNEIKKAIMQMEDDKGMLEHKVTNLKDKLSSVDRFAEMLDAVHKLRLQQDEQVKLQDRLKEQKAQLLQAEHRLNAMVSRLNEKRQERQQTNDVHELLRKLEEEVSGLEKQAMEQLPQQLQQKQRRMEELQHVLGEGATSDVELSQLQQQHAQLNRAVQQLEERKRSSASANANDKLSMFRQQANLVAKKKEQLQHRLTSVEKERGVIDGELQSKAGQLANVKPVPKGEDFRKYATELRGKTAQYKRMKAELSELRAEWGVVSRTETILQAQDAELAARLGEAEARRGVEGFGQAQEDLEKISQQKAEIDEMKGRTLDEMSQVVGEINDKIKRRKHQLAPQIMKLRKLRTEVRDRESFYHEKKSQYNSAKAGIDSDMHDVCREADDAVREAASEESAAVYYESMSSIEKVKLQRVADEKEGRFRRTLPDGTEITSIRQLYSAKVKQQEAASKELRERQKRIKENHGGNAKQVTMFKDLHKLLRAKIEAQQRARAEGAEMAAAEMQDTNIFTMPEDDFTNLS